MPAGLLSALEEEILFDLGKGRIYSARPPKGRLSQVAIAALPDQEKGVAGINQGLVLAWEKLMAVEAERTSHYVRPRESEYRITSQLLAEALQRLRSAATVAEIRSVCRQGCRPCLQKLLVDYQPLRIG